MPQNIWIREAGNRVLKSLGLSTDKPMAFANVTGDSNEPNQTLTLTSQRNDSGWVITSDQATFTGSPDRVVISAMTYFQQNSSNTYARINPELQLIKNGSVLAHSASAYQRHATGHDSSSNTISFTDHDPGTNPVYSLRSQQGSNQNDVLLIDIGHFSLEALLT